MGIRNGFQTLKTTSMNFLRPIDNRNETLVALIDCCCYHGITKFFSFTAQKFLFGCAFFLSSSGFLGFLINWSNRKFPAVNPAMNLTLAVCATGFDNYIVSHDYKLKLLHCDKENPSLSNWHPVCISLCTSASKREYIFFFWGQLKFEYFSFLNLFHFAFLYRLFF